MMMMYFILRVFLIELSSTVNKHCCHPGHQQAFADVQWMGKGIKQALWSSGSLSCSEEKYVPMAS